MSRDNRDTRKRKILPVIEIEVEEDGSQTLSVGDGCGKGCEDLTSELEKAFGGVRDREHTAGYNKTPDEHQRNRQGDSARARQR